MNPPLAGKFGIVTLVVVVSFLAAWQGSGPAWGAVSAIALGAGVAIAVFRGCSPHHRRGLNCATAPTAMDLRDRLRRRYR